jgi:5-hydroxyisourate hydrolase
LGYLTTHVLDTCNGTGAAGVVVELRRLEPPHTEPLSRLITDSAGRCATPLATGENFCRGQYELSFRVGDYFRARGFALSDPAFIDVAVIRFGVASPEQHYHVPLLVSPWSYSVYRGT